MAITLVTLVAVGSVAYSASQDYQGIAGSFGSRQGPALHVGIIQVGLGAVAWVNASILNKGLYPIQVSFSCDQPQPQNVTCTAREVIIAPGSNDDFDVKIVVPDLAAFTAGVTPHIPGNLTLRLDPFASMSLRVDLGSILVQGGVVPG